MEGGTLVGSIDQRWYNPGRLSRPVRVLILIGTLVVAGIIAGTALVVLEMRAKEINDAKRDLLSLDASLTEQAARSFQSVDLILENLAEEFQSEGIDTSGELSRMKSGRDTYATLSARVAGVPQLDALTIINAEGNLINFSRYYPIPAVSVADRDYFTALRDTVTDKPFLSVPVENRGTGTWTMYMARRLNSRSGQFIGLVLGGINLNYFEELYRTLQNGDGSGISLWRRDGVLLARYPALSGIGKVFAIKSFTDVLLHSDVGVYQTANSIDGTARVVATRAVRGYPIVVNVTRTEDEILSDWRRSATVVSGFGIFCAIAASFVIWALARQFGAYEAMTQVVAEREAAIVAREQAEAQLRQSQKLEAVGQLTTGVAHDFNNLLTAIIGNLEFLQSDLGGDNKNARRLAAIQRAADRAAKLTGQLLAFSRKQRLSPKVVDLNGIVDSMSELLRSTLGGTIRIQPRLKANLWPALVDPTQIELVILNLAINARDAMGGSGVLTIETDNVSLDGPDRPGAPPAGDYVMVAVNDTGTGMTPEVLARAFDPFFTTKEPGKGSGLGLSQVYGVAQQSGGGVRIDTVPGDGTTVRIYLPRTQETSAETRARGALPTLTGVTRIPITAGAVVLVVDDDSSVRATVATMIRDLGLTVIEADSGMAAFEQLKHPQRIDVLVVDYAMPTINGAEVAEAARQMRPNLPVIFVTGYAVGTPIDNEEWVLQKPFRSDDIARKLQVALAGGDPTRPAPVVTQSIGLPGQ